MNTLEFRAAIRPQLEEQVRKWLWFDLSPGDQRRLATGFRNHMRDTLGVHGKDVVIANMIRELPLSFQTKDSTYVKSLIDVLCNVFLISTDRYLHIDRTVSTVLRIRAYEYRMKNLLDELAFTVRCAKDRAVKEQVVLRTICGSTQNDWARLYVPRLRFY